MKKYPKKSKLIGQFYVGSLEMIKVHVFHIKKQKRENFIEIGLWFTPEPGRYEAETMRRLTLHVEELPELIWLLEKAREFIDQKRK